MLEYYVRLPQQAIPGELDADIIMRLDPRRLSWASRIFSLLIYNLANLDRERHNKFCGIARTRRETLIRGHDVAVAYSPGLGEKPWINYEGAAPAQCLD